MIKFFPRIIFIIYLLVLTVGKSYGVNLLEVYNIAVKNDPELLAAEVKHKATVQEYPIARSYLLPNLNFSASSQRTRESIDGTIYGSSSTTSQFTTDEFSINLKQPLYRRDLFSLLEKSEHEVAKSLAERDLARQDLIIRVAEAYFNILDSIDNINYVQSEKAAIKSQLEESKKDLKLASLQLLIMQKLKLLMIYQKQNILKQKI